MLTEDKKKRIDDMSLEDMGLEINLGHRSRFQRESFAYLKTRYEAKLREINTVKNTAQNPTTNHSNAVGDWHNMPLGKIAIEVAVVVISAFALVLINQFIDLK